MKTLATIVIALLMCNCTPSTPAPAPAEASPMSVCGNVQAYALSKNIVKQAIANPDAATFPSFEEGFVTKGGDWFTITCFFYREGLQVPYEVAVSCVGGDWQVAYVKVNGVDARAGANL